MWIFLCSALRWLLLWTGAIEINKPNWIIKKKKRFHRVLFCYKRLQPPPQQREEPLCPQKFKIVSIIWTWCVLFLSYEENRAVLKPSCTDRKYVSFFCFSTWFITSQLSPLVLLFPFLTLIPAACYGIKGRWISQQGSFISAAFHSAAAVAN